MPKMDKEGLQQARIRVALGSFPYSGTARLNFAREMTLEVIADNLEKLSETIKHYSDGYQEGQRELAQMKSDLAAVGRLLKLVDAKEGSS